MKVVHTVLRWMVLVAVFSWSSLVFADDAGVAGRAAMDKYKNAVVTVMLVIKQQFSMPGMGSQDQEDKTEVTGTVIDPTGLTVLSLSETDPSILFKKMSAGSDSDQMKMETTLSDVKMILEDGKELQAKVILRDKDLDLAFIRPLEVPAVPLSSIDLKDAASPEILDQILVLNRLGKVANRAYAASVDRIEAVISKPRTFYVPGQGQSTGSLGSPVFSLEGKVVGIVVLRSIGGSGGGGMSMRSMSDNLMPVVLPASDILEAGQQAPASAADVKDEPAPAPQEPAAVTIPVPEPGAAPAPEPAPGK